MAAAAPATVFNAFFRIGAALVLPDKATAEMKC
jgi:hypothetical protein